MLLHVNAVLMAPGSSGRALLSDSFLSGKCADPCLAPWVRSDAPEENTRQEEVVP